MNRDRSGLQVVLSAEGIYSPRPSPVPGDLMREWRIAALLVLLARCHRQTASIAQVHAYGRAMLVPEAQPTVQARQREPFATIPVFREDPAWTRAVDLAVGLGYATWTNNGGVALTDHGSGAARLISGSSALAPERAFLESVRPTQAAVEGLMGRRG